MDWGRLKVKATFKHNVAENAFDVRARLKGNAREWKHIGEPTGGGDGGISSARTRSVESYPDRAVRDSRRKGPKRRAILAHVSDEFQTLGSTVGIELRAPSTYFTRFQVEPAFMPSTDDHIRLNNLAVLERQVEVGTCIVECVNRPGSAD